MILTHEQIKQIVTSYFKAKPVKKVWLFGSYARGEADEVSDVDILVDIDYRPGIALEYISWNEELSKKLNKKIDIISAGWENKHIKPFIDKDKMVIYER